MSSANSNAWLPLLKIETPGSREQLVFATLPKPGGLMAMALRAGDHLTVDLRGHVLDQSQRVPHNCQIGLLRVRVVGDDRGDVADARKVDDRRLQRDARNSVTAVNRPAVVAWRGTGDGGQLDGLLARLILIAEH